MYTVAEQSLLDTTFGLGPLKAFEQIIRALGLVKLFGIQVALFLDKFNTHRALLGEHRKRITSNSLEPDSLAVAVPLLIRVFSCFIFSSHVALTPTVWKK